MANRVWAKLLGSLTPGLVKLTGVLRLGAAGAITTQSCNGFSVAHAGAGLYTVTLEDTFARLEGLLVTVAGAQPNTGATGYSLILASDTVDDSPPGKTFTFQMYNTTTLASAVPANSVELRLEMTLKNSSRTY